MLAKYAIAGFAGSALLTSVAFGQTPSVTTDSANTDKATTASPVDMASVKGNWRTSKLVGLSVYNDNNESLGSINDLLTDKNGDIKAVVLGVGGFLGVGEHLVAVPFDKVKFVNEPVAYTGAAGAPNAGAAKTTSTTSTTTTGAATTTATTAKANPWYPDHAVYSGTKDQLKAMTQFKYSTD
jgi:sporulation protein YlmC with PRC-barrel domain